VGKNNDLVLVWFGSKSCPFSDVCVVFLPRLVSTGRIWCFPVPILAGFSSSLAENGPARIVSAGFTTICRHCIKISAKLVDFTTVGLFI